MNSRSSRRRSPPRSNEGMDADSRHGAKTRSATTASHCMRRLLLTIKSSWSNSTDYLRHSARTFLLMFCLAFSVRSMASMSSFLHISDSIPTSNVSVSPRTVRYIVMKDHARVERLPLSMNPQVPKRQVEVSKNTPKRKSPGKLESYETTDCKAQYSWQMGSYPTCNYLYELDLEDKHARFLANGYWRDVWAVTEEGTGEACVLKTMRYEHNFTHRNYDRHRRDAVAMERLTKSPFVLDIYGFCGNSGLFEFGSGGDIAGAIWPNDNQPANLTKLQKLSMATQAAIGLAAVHNSDVEGIASIAHTDISPTQFIKVNNRYKLNDFNRARFLRWSLSKKQACPYKVGKNPGTNRAPEEYQYLEQTEKVDVYSLGNIFYMLLQGEWPFEDQSQKDAKYLVIKGKRPSFDAHIWNSTNPADRALKKAMLMCHKQNVTDRASARQVEKFLKLKLMEIYPGEMERWGVKNLL